MYVEDFNGTWNCLGLYKYCKGLKTFSLLKLKERKGGFQE